MTEVNPFSYWQQALFQMLDVSHPYKMNENKEELASFIAERAEEARENYNTLIIEGVNEQEAKDRTRNDILFSGLLFSPTDFLASYFWHEKQQELTVDERIELYHATKQIFEKYANDNFYEDAENEIKLNEELSNFFANK